MGLALETRKILGWRQRLTGSRPWAVHNTRVPKGKRLHPDFVIHCRSRRSIPFFNCDFFDCSTQIVNLASFRWVFGYILWTPADSACIIITTPHPCRRNNFFLTDFLDRATGRQGPAVFARLEAVEKRLQVSKMLSLKENSIVPSRHFVKRCRPPVRRGLGRCKGSKPSWLSSVTCLTTTMFWGTTFDYEILPWHLNNLTAYYNAYLI